MTIFAGTLMALGVGFLVIAALGLLRLPDALQRMHSATKAGTLGTTLVILGALQADGIDRMSTGLLTIFFLLVTLPIGAQLLGRATYLSDARLEGLTTDPLQEVLLRSEASRPPIKQADPSRVGRSH